MDAVSFISEALDFLYFSSEEIQALDKTVRRSSIDELLNRASENAEGI